MEQKNKILEIVIEPSTIYKKDRIKIKLKCSRDVKVFELKKSTVKDLKKYRVKELKGVDV